MKTEGDALSGHQVRKEGRKYYICSSRLGLIRWDIIQHVKAVQYVQKNFRAAKCESGFWHSDYPCSPTQRHMSPCSRQSTAAGEQTV